MHRLGRLGGPLLVGKRDAWDLQHGVQDRRIENRIIGADANPYLAMAAALASGLYGIKNKLELKIPATTGNGYQDKRNGSLAPNLLESATMMKSSAIAKELFGEEFVAHFTNTRLWEWRQFGKSVTDWELKRYFEII